MRHRLRFIPAPYTTHCTLCGDELADVVAVRSPFLWQQIEVCAACVEQIRLVFVERKEEMIKE